MSKKRYLSSAVVLTILVIGFIFGKLESIKSSVATQRQIEQEGSLKIDREGSHIKNWVFINPLLDCGDMSSISNKKIAGIEDSVDKLIKKQTPKDGGQISVYFRDLNNGPWFGENEAAEFFPGSLLKVARMIAVFKIAEKNPSILEKQVFIQEIVPDKYGTVQFYKPEVTLEVGKTYTISDLVTMMIVYSDNNATRALENLVGNEELYKTYDDLGIQVPYDRDYNITIRNYASFFRVLYNASYLSREYSEQALELLSRATFKKSLRAGVPLSVPVSHKFGERTTSDGLKQLHDCGIIYHPETPYLLCVMSQGKTFDELASLIAQISKVVYDNVNE